MPSLLELKTDAEYIDFLTREYGWQITGPSYTVTPQPRLEYIGRNQEQIDLLRHYLTGTYSIRDQFDKDHRARHDFLVALGSTKPEVKEWIRLHSKLKRDRIAIDVVMGIDAIIADLQETFPELYRRLENFTLELHRTVGGYDQMSFDEKVAYVKKVDEVAYRFLEELRK